MSYYEAGLLFAITGIVITRLQEPGEILGFIPNWLPDGSIFKKLITCSKCVAGQLAFWALLLNGVYNLEGLWYFLYSTTIIILSIFFAMIITLIIDRLE